jgi:hypothetical protein
MLRADRILGRCLLPLLLAGRALADGGVAPPGEHSKPDEPPKFEGVVQASAAHGRPLRFKLTVLTLANTRIVLSDPEGRTAVMMGFEAHSNIRGCEASADPTVISGDCDLFVGRGSTATISNPIVGTWTLELVRNSPRWCAYPTRLRLEAGKSENELPALSGVAMLAASDSIRWSLRVEPHSIRVVGG